MFKKLASWDSIIILLTIAVLIVASLAVDNFGTSRNFTFMVLDLMPIILVALPMTFIIITGEIDLSVASILGLTSSLMGWFWNHDMAIQTIIPLCVLIGAVAGVLNGFLITGLGLPSLAVTIGTLALYRGLAFVVLGDSAVADFPFSFTGWVTGTIDDGSIPNVLIPIIAMAVVFGVLLHATPIGRSLYAIGANAQAAHFSGIRVARTKFWLYVVSGAVSGLVGVLWTLRYSSARADNGIGLELAVVAAVLLGGVSIFGGKGSLPGVLAGVVLLTALQNALRLEDVSGQALNIVTGSLLVLSVLIPNIVTTVRGNWQRRRLRQSAAQ
ncbi:ABC transporter permease [Actinoplanes sp. KI2]|uniref:ABC transporter permease n=1 Tax=Actinoplanes sp. KI2 TaxID=2983315 RepID=UPI0021D58904|nr:ABC transporter permease [Actinoplanes sp. KI2]MCU7723069.1 ABC transporter permease [Actinoplanes sp. KI2]